MLKSFFFILRIALAWSALFLLLSLLWSATPGSHNGNFLFAVYLVTLIFVTTGTFSHLRRVRLISGGLDHSALSNRQRRQIEIPFEAGEAFDLLDAAIRELPRCEDIESARDSLQIRAKIKRPLPYGHSWLQRINPANWLGGLRNQIFATVTPGDGIGSVTLLCEPEAAAWSDWFGVDDGTNLENAEAVSRAITRRVAERRRDEQRTAAQTATEKELTVARLNLLHAQVEPHFLYNTLASAQVLTRSEPAQADKMLGHLIQYLRHSLPSSDEQLSTLGDELERTRAYLEIVRIRMGARLSMEVDVPDTLRTVALPPMMLQTLVENAIKHGLEPKPGGGTVWILARRDDEAVSITVADNGQGFGAASGGTGIGLKNVRERLRLIYGSNAGLSVVANVPDRRRRHAHRTRHLRHTGVRRRQDRGGAMTRAILAEDEAAAAHRAGPPARRRLAGAGDRRRMRGRCQRAGSHRRAAPRGRIPGYPHARPHRPGGCGGGAGGQSLHPGGVHHRLQPIRHRCLRARRSGLPAQAHRPRTPRRHRATTQASCCQQRAAAASSR